MGWGGSVHCRMLGILLIVEPSVASRAFWRTRHVQKRSNLTHLVLQLSKMKQNAKTALVWLAFLINTHQNANQKPIGSTPTYRAQCTLPPQPIYQTLLFDFSRVWFQDEERTMLYFMFPRLSLVCILASYLSRLRISWLQFETLPPYLDTAISL